MLSKKLFRTFGKYRVQFLSMIVMVALGVGIFLGFNIEWYSLETDVNQAFDETGFADYRLVDESGFSESDLDRIMSIDGVTDGTRYLSANTTSKSDGDIITLTVTTNENVSGFIVTSGNGYDSTSNDGIWLSDKYAAANDISTGDSMTLVYKGVEFSGTVEGLIKSGEYLIYLPDETQLMPDFKTSGFAYVSPTALERFLGYAYYPQINVISSMEKSDFTDAAYSALGKTVVVVSKDDTVSYSEAMGESEEGKTMASILPVFFLAIALLTMITTMHRITINEKTQIGTLKALGFKDSVIRRHYASYALMVALIGTALGVVVGYLLAKFIMSPEGSMGTYLDMACWDFKMPTFCVFIIALIVVALYVIGYLSVRKISDGTPAEVLKPYVPKHIKNMWLEKTSLWNKFGFGTKWNLRDVFRHKARTLMTLLGVIGCVILLMGSFGMRDTMDSFVDTFYEGAINYETNIILSDSATNDDALDICEQYDGDWAAKTAVVVNDKSVALEVYGITHDLVRFVDKDMNYVELKDGGAYICSRIANENGLGVGDSLTFSTYGTNVEHTVTVLGVLNSLSESIVMTQGSAEKAGLDYDINNVYTKETEIASTPLIESTISKSSIVSSFDTFMEIMDSMIWLLVIAAAILGLVVLYNLGTMSYIERMREMATLKVLGFKDKKIGSILISQNLWLTVVGIIIGIPLGMLVLDYLIKALASDYEMKMVVGIPTFIASVVLTLVISLAVGLLISRNNRKIDMVVALKDVE